MVGSRSQALAREGASTRRGETTALMPAFRRKQHGALRPAGWADIHRRRAERMDGSVVASAPPVPSARRWINGIEEKLKLPPKTTVIVHLPRDTYGQVPGRSRDQIKQTVRGWRYGLASGSKNVTTIQPMRPPNLLKDFVRRRATGQSCDRRIENGLIVVGIAVGFMVAALEILGNGV